MQHSNIVMMEKAHVKKLFIGFGLAFLFLFLILMVNQILLMDNVINQITFVQFLTLLLYSIPSVIVMSLPFSVCLGFSYVLTKIGFFEMFKKSKKNILPVLISGLVIFTAAYVVFDFILPSATQNFRDLYRSALSNEIVDTANMSPREMNSINLVKSRSQFMNSERDFNLYLLELNKRFSIPFGALVFTIFSTSLSILLKKRIKITGCIAVVSCVIYWAMLMYGEFYSIRANNFGILAMWLPNIVFLCISTVLYYIGQKINRSSSLADAM